jgi:hypothetical protein
MMQNKDIRYDRMFYVVTSDNSNDFFNHTVTSKDRAVFVNTAGIEDFA